MLQSLKRIAAEDADSHSKMVSAPELFHAAVNFARRQFSIIALTTLGVVALVGVYLLTAPPSYTAEAAMIIDTRKVQMFQQQQQQVQSDLAIDSATVDSQVEILKSENVALAVIRDLHLTEDPEFNGSAGRNIFSAVLGLVGTIVNFVTGAEPPSNFEQERRAAETFAKLLTVKRVGLTYVIEVSFRSLNADRAAQIANAVVDAYVVDQLEAKYQTARRAGVWMQDRIKELREQAASAEAAVVAFKEKNNIVETGGRLTTEQQLAEVNSQIVQARATTAEAKARLDRIDEIIRTEIPDATVTDTLKSDVVTKLRQQYLEYASKEADWSARYGANHLAAVNLRNQMQQIRKAIVDELKRIAQTYRSDYEIAKVREESIQASMSSAVAQSQTASQAQLTLRDLESSAQTYRALHDSFLQKHMESVQQQSFPITEARSISAATRPLRKSHPRSLLILAIGAAGGMLLGAGAGFLRDQLDRVFRTANEIEEQLGLDCLAILPALKGDITRAFNAGRAGNRPNGKSQAINSQGALSYAIKSPFSRFTEAVRAIKVAVDLESNRADKAAARVVGICSSLPDEGKSTVATNLAQLSAMSGARTVLVDCDLRNPSLSQLLAPDAKTGILEVLTGAATLEQALRRDPTTNLAFLPIYLKERLAHSSEILPSEQMMRLFDLLRQRFDYIIVDFPPLAPVVDVRATAHLVDYYLFVVEWGRTKIDVAQHALTSARSVYDKTLGVVLNKANMQTFGRYQGYTGNYYSNRSYGRYGYVD
jgi:succinoglycan biosynthesis transport protein ExoP